MFTISSVYRGTYKEQNVAVKMLMLQGKLQKIQENEKDTLMKEALYLFQNLRHEVMVLAHLSHPNVVSLLGVSFRPVCMLLEFAPMGSLCGILDGITEDLKQKQDEALYDSVLCMPGGVLGHSMSTKIAKQVAQALMYIHEVGIIYRDLKSENVLVWSLNPNDKVNIKLADYGISRFANPGGVRGMEGTPGYQAPETIQHNKAEEQPYDEKVDIYSFAMLLYEMLTGLRPFEYSTSHDINQAIVRGDRPLVNEGNLDPAFPAIEELMNDCWRQSPIERPSAQEIVAQLSNPGVLCRKSTITRCMNKTINKIDAVHSPLATSGPLSDGYVLYMWTKNESDKQFCTFDAHKGTFKQIEMGFSNGKAYATLVVTQGEKKRIWVSTTDNCVLQVYDLNSTPPNHLWSFYMNDATLCFLAENKDNKITRIFAGMVKGTLCIFTSKSSSCAVETRNLSEQGECRAFIYDDSCRVEVCDWFDPVILNISSAQSSVKCLTFVGSDKLWCGCGNGIVIVDISNLQVLKHIPVFVKKMKLVNELVSDATAVWGIGGQFSCVLKWDIKTYSLLNVFDCSSTDPTGLCIKSDPKDFEDTFDLDEPKSSSEKKLFISQEHQPTGVLFQVNNESLPRISISRSQRNLSVKYNAVEKANAENAKLRPIIDVPEQHTLKAKKSKSIPSISTCARSLLIFDGALWIGRAMGDVIILDITNSSTHGTVLARLATSDCEKYGNKSSNKLIEVAGKYIVSLQWLESTERASEGIHSHQAITVWNAWTRKNIEEYRLLCENN